MYIVYISKLLTENTLNLTHSMSNSCNWINHGLFSIFEVIKRNESYVGNIDFEMYNQLKYEIPLYILLFSAGQNCVYFWNYKSDSDEVFSKT